MIRARYVLTLAIILILKAITLFIEDNEPYR